MRKQRQILFTIMVIIVSIYFTGCSNTFSKKSTETPEYLQNFIDPNNVKNISIQAYYKTNSGFEKKDYKVITDKLEINNITNKINEQKFLRLDLFASTNNSKSVFDSAKINIQDKENLDSISINLEFNKPMFENSYLVIISYTRSEGVEIAAKKIGNGHDTIFICSDREFINQIFNQAVSSK